MLKDLIRYTELADRSVIDVFNNSQLELPLAEYLFSHVLNAQHIWLSRINQTEPLFERFHVHPKQSFEGMLAANIAKLSKVLENDDLERVVTYKTSAGDPFENKLGDIMFHVVNHSTYHRAQIASQFKLAGLTPPVTDYVFLRRQGEF